MDTQNLYNKDGSVVELTANSFDLSQKKVVSPHFNGRMGLITIYAPWCGHCRKMVDTWKDLGSMFRYRFVMAALNVENDIGGNREVAHKFKVKQYPTVKFVDKNGKVKNFNGLLTRDDLLYFIGSKL